MTLTNLVWQACRPMPLNRIMSDALLRMSLDCHISAWRLTTRPRTPRALPRVSRHSLKPCGQGRAGRNPEILPAHQPNKPEASFR